MVIPLFASIMIAAFIIATFSNRQNCKAEAARGLLLWNTLDEKHYQM